MPISLALSGLDAPESLRERLTWAAGLGFRAVQLDVRAADCRPREMGRSARRDLAGLLRRCELAISGVDLWIPPAHFTEPAHVDRAVSAASEANDFAADIAALAGGRAVVSLTLPAQDAGDALAALAERALSRGSRIADHQWPARDDLAKIAALSTIGVGIDPATILLGVTQPASPATAAVQAGSRLVSARLSDIAASGRTEPGKGRLDLLTYSVATATAAPGVPLVLDLRNVAAPERTARNVLRRFGIDLHA